MHDANSMLEIKRLEHVIYGLNCRVIALRTSAIAVYREFDGLGYESIYELEKTLQDNISI